MKGPLATLQAFIVLLIAHTAQAAPGYRAVIGAIGTLGTIDTNTLRGGTWSDAEYTHITVTCYYFLEVNGICAGGGNFDRILYNPSDPNCNDFSADNSATLFAITRETTFTAKILG